MFIFSVPNCFCFGVGLVMLFNSMNLDINNGGGHFGSRFLGFYETPVSFFHPILRMVNPSISRL